ncbi:MAG: immunity 42 family protein [Polyangiaceae bacterium]|nr:immunity 42 family protein [Polyangiaceae bacterium]
MIAGNRDRFAIECEIVECFRRRGYGPFRFWIGGKAVGNWEEWAHLSWVAHRMPFRFALEEADRHSPRLFELPSDIVFRVLHDRPRAFAPYLDERADSSDFNISFDVWPTMERFLVFLIKNDIGTERCLWREDGKNEIHECFLNPMEVETVTDEFCAMFRAAIAARPENASPTVQCPEPTDE